MTHPRTSFRRSAALQSGLQAGHSTETAILRVLSDIILAVDRGDVAGLVLLDLSAAFETVDRDILLQRLRVTFGINDVAHRGGSGRIFLFGRNMYAVAKRSRL